MPYGVNRPRYVGDERQGSLPEYESIAAIEADFNKHVRPLLLANGRTAEEIDLRNTAQRARERYRSDFAGINAMAAEYLNGQEFLAFKHNYAPSFYGWAPSVDPEGEAADRDIAWQIKHSDPDKSLLKSADGSADKATLRRHDKTIPDWTPVQEEVLLSIDAAAHKEASGQTTPPNVVQANRMILNGLMRKLYASAAAHYAKEAHPGEWTPNDEERAWLATAKQIQDILNNYKFVEFAPAELPKTYNTYFKAFVETEGRLLPKTMDYISLYKMYLDRTYAAAMNKSVLNAYLTFTDETGRPLVMAKPGDRVSLTRGVVKQDTWRIWAACSPAGTPPVPAPPTPSPSGSASASAATSSPTRP